MAERSLGIRAGRAATMTLIAGTVGRAAVLAGEALPAGTYHPSVDGYHLWAQALLPAVAEAAVAEAAVAPQH